MKQRWLGALVWLVSLAGCMPSKEVRSAEQIGCQPEEIRVVSEDYHLGLPQAGETWIAECRGRQYVCSRTNEQASEQLGCKELQQPNPERVIVAQAPAAPPPAAPAVRPVPPRSVVR